MACIAPPTCTNGGRAHTHAQALSAKLPPGVNRTIYVCDDGNSADTKARTEALNAEVGGNQVRLLAGREARLRRTRRPCLGLGARACGMAAHAAPEQLGCAIAAGAPRPSCSCHASP